MNRKLKIFLAVATIAVVAAVATFAATQYLQVWRKGHGSTGVKAYIDTDGNFWSRGTITSNSTLASSGATITGDLSIARPTDGGNAGAKNTIIGNPQVVLVSLGNLTNGTTETTRYVDDSPAGEWVGLAANITGETAMTQAALDEATDVITINSHGFTNGQKLQYWDNGNTAPTTDPANQCDDGDVVYVIYLTANTFSLASSQANAYAGTEIDFTNDGDADTQFLSSDIIMTADTTYYKIGSTSLKLEFTATAAAAETWYLDITNDDLEANESVGFWIYSTEALTAGDVDLAIDDDTTDSTYDVPAVAANVWTWVEVDVSALAAGTGDVVDKVGFQLSTAGAAAHGDFSIYIDGMYKWDASDESALYQDIEEGGVLCVMTITKSASLSGDAETLTYPVPAQIVEQTGYFVHYQSGNDAIVVITDQSTKNGNALVAYK